MGVGSRGGGTGSAGGEGDDSLSGVGDRRRTGISRKWKAGGTTLRAVVWVGKLKLMGAVSGGGNGSKGDAGRGGVGGWTVSDGSLAVIDGSENGDILGLSGLAESGRGSGSDMRCFSGDGDSAFVGGVLREFSEETCCGIRFFSGEGAGSGGGGAASSGGGGGGSGGLFGLSSRGGAGGASSGGVGGRSEGGGGGKRGDLGRGVVLAVGKANLMGVLESVSAADSSSPCELKISLICERLGGVLERDREGSTDPDPLVV